MSPPPAYEREFGHAHRMLGIGFAIALVGWFLFWFEFAYAAAAVIFTVGFLVLAYGKIRYIMAWRKKQTQASAKQ